jgi:hypothetical protein
MYACNKLFINKVREAMPAVRFVDAMTLRAGMGFVEHKSAG